VELEISLCGDKSHVVARCPEKTVYSSCSCLNPSKMQMQMWRSWCLLTRTSQWSSRTSTTKLCGLNAGQKSVGFGQVLCAKLGAGQVGSGSDRDPLRGWTWLQWGGLLCRLGLRILYFGSLRIAWTSADVGVAWQE